MMEYPKTENLFERDPATHKVRPGILRLLEFGIPQRWLVTEKIDGTNVRIILGLDVTYGMAAKVPWVKYAGRTDEAQMPPFLLDMLQERFPYKKVVAAFEPDTEAVIYGEGYGPKIQKGGGNYSPMISFRVFDVVVFGASGRPWWLNWDGVESVAEKIGAKTVPVIARDCPLSEAVDYVESISDVAAAEGGKDVQQEGIVARTDPLLFMRTGARLVWKLKAKDL